MRLLGLTFLALVLSASPALADRGGHKHRHKHKHSRVVVHGGGGDRVVVHKRGHKHKRGRIKVASGRYVFPGGVVRVYKRPAVRRYYDVRVRPPIVVEHYDPVPGYVWVGGQWYWGGSEWVWAPGYWDVDASASVNVGFSAGVVVH